VGLLVLTITMVYFGAVSGTFNFQLSTSSF
jgi:hypothetical protein